MEAKGGEGKSDDCKIGRGEGEGKAEGKDGDDAPPPIINLVGWEVSPNSCNVEEELELSMDFEVDRDVDNAYWEIKFLVDSVHTREIIILGRTERESYFEGPNNMLFRAPSVDVSGIRPCTLANAGLLTATLWADGKECVDVNAIVQVAKDGEAFTRTVYSPLE